MTATETRILDSGAISSWGALALFCRRWSCSES